MNPRIAPLTVVVMAALGLTTFAQAPPPTQHIPPTPKPIERPNPPTIPTTTPTTAGKTSRGQSSKADDRDTKPKDDTTITGCVEKESDYRSAHNQGNKPAGAEAASRTEYVLTRVTSDGAVGSAGRSPSSSATPSSSPSPGLAYQLTGVTEEQLGRYVNQRVELTGRFKPTSVPSEAEAKETSNLALRRFEVTAVHAASGACR